MEIVLNRAKCIVSFEDSEHLPYFSKIGPPSQDTDIRVIGEEEKVIVDIETSLWIKSLNKPIQWIRDGDGVSAIKIGEEKEDDENLAKALERLDIAKDKKPADTPSNSPLITELESPAIPEITLEPISESEEKE